MPNSSLNFVGYVIYDDGCHLHKYIHNPCRSQLTKAAQAMCDLNVVIDGMHMKGHIDGWCKRTCDPKLFPELNDVSMHACVSGCVSVSVRGRRKCNQMIQIHASTINIWRCGSTDQSV